MHSDEISFIIEAAPRQPENDMARDDPADPEDVVDEEAAAAAADEDDDNDDDYNVGGDEAVAEDSESERGDGDSDAMLDEHERLPPFVNPRDQYAWIRFIWQVWPFSCENIFEEIVFEFQGIREEDLSIRDHDTARENGEDDDDDDGRDAIDNQGGGDDRDAEGGADDADLQVAGNRASERADEPPSPSPSPVATVPDVGSKVEEMDEEAFRWWHEFDYDFSESVGIDVDEEDPPPAGGEKRTRESAQDAKRERKPALRLTCDREADLADAPEEEENSEEGGSRPGPGQAEAEPLPGPSRKRSRDEAGLNRETRRTKRLCRRSECDAKTSQDSPSGGAATRS